MNVQATKTYTAGDYADIIDHLVKHWCISEVTGATLNSQTSAMRRQRL